MNEHGKVIDVFIEQSERYDERTGVTSPTRHLMIWADDAEHIIKSVKGVTSLFTFSDGVRYSCDVDPRYDIEFVKREIEAAIMCREQ